MQLLERMPASEIRLREVARAADVSHSGGHKHSGGGNHSGCLACRGAAYITFAVTRPYVFQVMYDPTVCVPGAPSEVMAPLIDELEGLLASVASKAGLDSAADVQGL